MPFPHIPRDQNPTREALFKITDHQLFVLGWSVQVAQKFTAYWYDGATSRYQMSDNQLKKFSHRLAEIIAGLDVNSLLFALKS